MLYLIFWIVVVGIICAVVQRSPLDSFFKFAIYAVCAIWILWILFGFFGGVSLPPGPHR